MEAFRFTVIAGGLDPHADGFEDRFFEAGCDDATVALQKGAIVLDFTREAASFDDAVKSAIQDVERAGARVERIEPDHLVSLTDIAKRANLSKAAISNYAAGDRCQGFPPPFSRVTTDSPLWDWAVVARWLCENGKISSEAAQQARFVRDTNDSIGASRMQTGKIEAA